MDATDSTLLEGVRSVLIETLALKDRADAIGPDTPLFGALPELDSLSVVELLVEIEKRFGIEISEESVTAADFENLASLTDFVARSAP